MNPLKTKKWWLVVHLARHCGCVLTSVLARSKSLNSTRLKCVRRSTGNTDFCNCSLRLKTAHSQLCQVARKLGVRYPLWISTKLNVLLCKEVFYPRESRLSNLENTWSWGEKRRWNRFVQCSRVSNISLRPPKVCIYMSKPHFLLN